MKYISGLILITFLLSFTYTDDIYSVPVNSINGSTIDLGNFRGKKILFVVLPPSPQDSVITGKELLDLESKYANSLVVIGILAEETGFKKANAESAISSYKDHKSNFLLAEGMKVKKAAGKEQSALFQWLTNKNKNRHFDADVQGVGHKFFVDETGDLYAVMGPQIKLSNPVIERILSRQMLKK
jgi:glutathione peroxidase